MTNYVRVIPGPVSEEDLFRRTTLKEVVREVKRLTGRSVPDVANLLEIPRNNWLSKYNVYPLEIDPRPSYDGETQRLVEGGYVADGPGYRLTWAIEDIPQSEIDQAKEQLALSEAEKLLGKMIFQLNNRVRVLEGKPEITRQQFVNFLKANL